MMPYRVELATPANDPLLRQVLAATPMPGAISLEFRREPSYLAAAVVEGAIRQVLIARELSTGNVVALGTRSVADRFLNGQPAPVGYLSNLRIVPAHRRGRILAAGFRFLKQLHEAAPVPLYLTTIAEGNTAAQALLTSARPPLPRYVPAGRFHTAILALRPRRPFPPPAKPVAIRPARLDDQPAILAFLHRVGAARQFFPCYRDADLFTPAGLLRDLHPPDLLLAFHDRQLVGTLGAWDQTRFRQNVVRSYAPPLRQLRPLYNLWAGARHLPRLPRPGEVLRSRLAALPLLAPGHEDAFHPLLAQLLARTRAAGADHLLVGLHDADPLLPLLRQVPARWYTTAVYLVCWPDGQTALQQLDHRPPYLELGSL